MIQKSFVMMKPDAVQRRLMGKILSRFEEKGLQIVACKLIQIDEDLAKTHYGEHADKPFFEGLVEYIIKSIMPGASIESARRYYYPMENDIADKAQHEILYDI